MQVVKKGVFGALFSRTGEAKTEFSSFMDPDMVDSPVQSEAEGDAGIIMGQAPSGSIDLASGRPSPQPQALGSRLGGWLSNATVAAGIQSSPFIAALVHNASLLFGPAHAALLVRAETARRWRFPSRREPIEKRSGVVGCRVAAGNSCAERCYSYPAPLRGRKVSGLSRSSAEAGVLSS